MKKWQEYYSTNFEFVYDLFKQLYDEDKFHACPEVFRLTKAKPIIDYLNMHKLLLKPKRIKNNQFRPIEQDSLL